MSASVTAQDGEVLFCFSALFFFKTCTHLVGQAKQGRLFFSESCEKPTWFRLKRNNNKILQLLYSVKIFQKVTIFHSETFVDASHFRTATLKTRRMDLYYVRHRLTSPLTHTICSILLWLISQFCVGILPKTEW